MKFLFDLFPIILFFVAYKFAGIFAATAVAIAAAPPVAFAQHVAQAAIEVAPQFFQVGRTLIRPLAATALVITAIAPLRVVQRHEYSDC